MKQSPQISRVVVFVKGGEKSSCWLTNCRPWVLLARLRKMLCCCRAGLPLCLGNTAASLW